MATMEIRNPRLILLKGGLFLLAAILAGGLLLAEAPRLKVALLLAVALWCACRFYYFAFYVIEHYVDSEYRFAGLSSFVRYLLVDRARRAAGDAARPPAE